MTIVPVSINSVCVYNGPRLTRRNAGSEFQIVVVFSFKYFVVVSHVFVHNSCPVSTGDYTNWAPNGRAEEVSCLLYTSDAADE